MSKITDEMLKRVAGLPSREASAILFDEYGISVGKSTINDARNRARENGGTLPLEDDPEQKVTVEAEGSSVPRNKEEVLAYLAARGITPQEYKITYGFSSNGTRDKFWSNSYPLPQTTLTEASDDSWADWGKSRIENFTFIPAPQEFLTESLVLQPTDYQIGKTDVNGGTAETTDRALTSFAKFTERVKEFRPQRVLFANTGDIIENFCNTPSQESTNDLDLPSQVAHAFALELEGIKMVAPLVSQLIYATVPSNHGRWRTGQKQDAGDTHADWGIAIAQQVAVALGLNERFGHVQTIIPQRHFESMTVQLGDTRIGMVHGHQANVDKLGDWWANQDHGRMPTWDADILLVGHYHSLRVQQSGDGRWLLIGPSSDPGSSWYANIKGQRAQAGMLSFSTEAGQWDHLKVL